MLFQGKLKKETRNFEQYAIFIASCDHMNPRLLHTWLQQIHEHEHPHDTHVLAQDVLPFDHLLNALDRPRTFFDLFLKTGDPSLLSSLDSLWQNKIIGYEYFDGQHVAFPLFDLEAAKQSRRLFHPPSLNTSKGEFKLGRVIYRSDRRSILWTFYLRSKELTGHLLICGISGSGKTNTVYVLCNSLINNGIKVLILEGGKTEYRQLVNHPGLKDKIKVKTIGKRINPLRLNVLVPPPGVSTDEWARLFAELFCNVYMMYDPSIAMVHECLLKVYEKANQEGREFPTLTELYQEILNYENVSEIFKERKLSVLTRLHKINAALGQNISVPAHESLTIVDLLDQNLIIELSSLPDIEKLFILETFFLAIHTYFDKHPIQQDLEHVIVLDEIHSYTVNATGNNERNESLWLVRAKRMYRQYGIGFVIIAQSPSKLLQPLRDCSVCICHRLKESKDMKIIADQIGYIQTNKRETIARTLRSLPDGVAVVDLVRNTLPHFHPEWLDNPHHTPFLIKIPFVKTRIPSDGEIAEDEGIKESSSGDEIDEFKAGLIPTQNTIGLNYSSSIQNDLLIQRIKNHLETSCDTLILNYFISDETVVDVYYEKNGRKYGLIVVPKTATETHIENIIQTGIRVRSLGIREVIVVRSEETQELFNTRMGGSGRSLFITTLDKLLEEQ